MFCFVLFRAEASFSRFFLQLQEQIASHPTAAVELIDLFQGAYSNPLYQVLCAPLAHADMWRKLKINDVVCSLNSSFPPLFHLDFPRFCVVVRNTQRE